MKKTIVAVLLTITMLLSMLGCNSAEEPVGTEVTQSEETSDSEDVAEDSVQEEMTEEGEAATEEVKEGDNYALYWLRGQDFSGEPAVQQESIPLFGGMESNFGLGGQSFSEWSVFLGLTQIDGKTVPVYSTLEEIIANEEDTIRGGYDDFYTVSKPEDENSGISFTVNFVNLSEEELTLKQIYENGWWYISVYNDYLDNNDDYPYENALFEFTGYTPVEIEGSQWQHEYMYMDYLVSTMGNPNFLSFSAKSSNITWYKPTVDEALELMPGAEDGEETIYNDYNALAYYIGWVYDDYVIFCAVEDCAKDDFRSMEVTGLYYFPSSCFDMISYESIEENYKLINVGPNVLPEWNEKMQNGKIIKSEPEQ